MMVSMHNLRAMLGEQTRSLIYVDDCIEGAMRVMAGDSALPVWEPSITLADGLEHTYRWIVDQLSAAVPLAIAPHESTPQQKIAPSLSQGGDTDGGFLREADR